VCRRTARDARGIERAPTTDFAERAPTTDFAERAPTTDFAERAPRADERARSVTLVPSHRLELVARFRLENFICYRFRGVPTRLKSHDWSTKYVLCTF